MVFVTKELIYLSMFIYGKKKGRVGAQDLHLTCQRRIGRSGAGLAHQSASPTNLTFSGWLDWRVRLGLATPNPTLGSDPTLPTQVTPLKKWVSCNVEHYGLL